MQPFPPHLFILLYKQVWFYPPLQLLHSDFGDFSNGVCSVNFYTQKCISDMLNGCQTHQIVTGALLRCTIFGPYAFRSTITAKHQNFARCVTVSRASKTYVQKSCKLQETVLSMFWLLDRSSAVKCKTVGSLDEPQPAWRAVRNLDFHLQKVLRFMAFDVTL